MGNVYILWQTRTHHGERAHIMANTHTSRGTCIHHDKDAHIIRNVHTLWQIRTHHGERVYIIGGKLITNKCVPRKVRLSGCQNSEKYVYQGVKTVKNAFIIVAKQ